MNIRRHGRRFAWLMVGAAIGTTVVLVLGLGAPLGTGTPTSSVVLIAGVAPAVLLGGLLGLVPGVRELEVTGARSMLGVQAELVVPRRMGLVHRLQDVAWVQLHLLLGLLAAGCLTMLLPASVLLILESIQGAGRGGVLPVPDSVLGRVAAVVLGLLGVLVGLGAAAPLGALAARIAPRLLGPTSGDRLEVALARVDREADRIRIARDLHDGIGHSLTIVSIQAAAGRRVLERDPDAAEEALGGIETTAREALDELDAVLAQLREERAADGGGRRRAGSVPGPPTAEGSSEASIPQVATQSRSADAARSRPSGAAQSPSAGAAQSGLADGAQSRLVRVVEDHRAAGMDLHTELRLPSELPALQREHLLRIVGELLTNAHRHAGPGPVQLTVRAGEGPTGEPATIVTVENPLPPRSGRRPVLDPRTADQGGHAGGAGPVPAEVPRGGRGLVGTRERLELWGGTLEAGPHDSAWRARAVVPLLEERTES